MGKQPILDCCYFMKFTLNKKGFPRSGSLSCFQFCQWVNLLWEEGRWERGKSHGGIDGPHGSKSGNALRTTSLECRVQSDGGCQGSRKKSFFKVFSLLKDISADLGRSCSLPGVEDAPFQGQGAPSSDHRAAHRAGNREIHGDIPCSSSVLPGREWRGTKAWEQCWRRRCFLWDASCVIPVIR